MLKHEIFNITIKKNTTNSVVSLLLVYLIITITCIIVMTLLRGNFRCQIVLKLNTRPDEIVTQATNQGLREARETEEFLRESQSQVPSPTSHPPTSIFLLEICTEVTTQMLRDVISA